VVCSRHFKTEDFRWTVVRKCLKPDAIPSVFPWTGEVNTRRPPKDRTSVSRKILADIHVPAETQEFHTSDDLPPDTCENLNEEPSLGKSDE
jgi:hypothetical protein